MSTSRPPPDSTDTVRRALAALETPGAVALTVRGADGSEGVTVDLPDAAIRALKKVLAQMAGGQPVAVFAPADELTTQQAANLLNVSRPFLVGLLERGEIPFRRVGSHRRVLASDVLAYRTRDDEERSRVADELAAEAQRLDLGY